MSNFSYHKLQSKLHENISRWIVNNSHADKRMITLRVDDIILSRDLSLAKVKCYHANDLESLVPILNKLSYSVQKHIKETLVIRRIPKIKFIASPESSPQQLLEEVLNELAETH
ncbi:ribosome-binding factor A [Gammaproteobacteria bacterium]|nr:ribosome-binding factor A [Gammaproteobacteria bacterium]